MSRRCGAKQRSSENQRLAAQRQRRGRCPMRVHDLRAARRSAAWRAAGCLPTAGRGPPPLPEALPRPYLPPHSQDRCICVPEFTFIRLPSVQCTLHTAYEYPTARGQRQRRSGRSVHRALQARLIKRAACALQCPTRASQQQAEDRRRRWPPCLLPLPTALSASRHLNLT